MSEPAQAAEAATATTPVEGAQQTAQPTGTTPASTETQPTSPVDRLRGYLQRKAERAAARNAPAQPEGEPAPTEGTPTEPTEQPEGKPEGADEPPPQTARERLEAARLRAENVRVQAELLELRKQHETVSRQHSELLAKAKKNPLKVVEELFGQPLPEIIKRAARGEFDDRTAQLPEDVREQLAYVEQLKREKEAREAAEREQQTRAADLKQVQSFVEAKAEELPFMRAVEGSAEQLLDLAYEHSKKTGERVDAVKLGELAAKLEADTLANFERFLTNEAFARTLLGKSERIRQALQGLLAGEPGKRPVSEDKGGKQHTGDGPRTLPNSVVNEVQSRTTAPPSDTPEARLERLRNWRARQG